VSWPFISILLISHIISHVMANAYLFFY